MLRYVCFIVLIAGSAWAGPWRQVAHPAAVWRAIPIPAAPSVWLSMDSTLYRSTDNGNTWRSTGLPNVSQVVVNAVTSEIYVVGRISGKGGRLWTSTDFGRTFSMRSPALPQLTLMAASALQPGTLVSVQNERVMLSSDDGSSWNQIDGSMNAGFQVAYPNCSIDFVGSQDAVISPLDANTVFASTEVDSFACSFNRTVLMVSTDRGQSWKVAQETTDFWAFQPDDYFPNRVFAFAPEALLQLTATGFRPLAGGQFSQAAALHIASVPGNPDQLLGVNQNHILLESQDGGYNWHSLPAFFGHQNFFDITAMRNGRFLALTGGGLYRGTPGGKWIDANSGFAPEPVLSVTGSGPNVYVLVYGSFARHSTDGGLHWKDLPLPRGVDWRSLVADPRDPAHLILAGESAVCCTRVTARFRVSFDAGATWKEFLAVRDGVPGIVAFDPAQPGLVYIGAGNTLYKSIQGGTDPVKLPLNISASKIVFDPADDQTLYMAACGVFKSTDGGRSVLEADFGIAPVDGGCQAEDIAPAGGPGRLLAVDSWGDIYKTVDGARRWHLLGDVASGPPDESGNPPGGEKLFAADQEGNRFYSITADGLYESTDRGMSWLKLNGEFNPQPRGYQFHTMTDPRIHPFYVATDLGLFAHD